ncbi:McrB family protein [Pontibacter sp. HSC-36F09]|uniref:McrB family protein n=1 Tax=Pontibacter sp. HSC-36F09 TaxID=2910966 RepID=UPI00209DE80D|nr:AAA family ATPase [Pontibacter sp. HSC-36F09]MCP2044702.1 5-methylcytosine-specific restriction protein B [Pontibacter sp. HSC-36F09]
MAFEPNNITKEHILKAVARIKSENIDLVPSTRWNVLVGNEQFPPKDLMRLAHEEMNGERIWFNSGGYATNRYFEKMGYAIVEKDSLADPIKELIAKYKIDLQENKLADEIYKWKLVNQYKGRPDLTASDFLEELKGINYSNLIYGVGIAVIYHLAKDRAEPYRECFKVLFNESLPLAERLEFFHTETLKLYRELVPEDKYSHHQDERTMATFLAFHNPDKYPFYKDSFYQKYCKLIGVKARKKGEKYLHYLELLNEFISEYLEPDTELSDMVDNLIPEDAFKDTNRKILAQDILYRMLDKGLEEIEIGDASVFKVSMGDFTDKEIEECISQCKILVHKDTKSLGRSNESQGSVFSEKMRVGDYFYLTPGNRNVAVSLLGRITGDAVPAIYNGYGNGGWLERPFELVSIPKNKTKYRGTQKWWTPNSNSTCVIIKEDELDEANKYLFEPYFMTKLVQTPINLDDNVDLTLQAGNDINLLKTPQTPLNIILYGPPGTGKTYNTIELAVELITGKKDSAHATNKKTFDQLKKEGQIEFITFHQNYSYEDFVVGIKPDLNHADLKFRKNEGIFYNICERAKKEYDKQGDKKLDNNKPQVKVNSSPSLKPFEEAFKEYFKPLIENGKEVEISMKSGKTLKIIEITGESIRLEYHSGSKDHSLTKATLKKAYEDPTAFDRGEFIKGGPRNNYRYVLEKLWKQGWQSSAIGHSSTVEKSNNVSQLKNYVLIIDEINRANISRVFGELITLLEEDKRLGAENELRLTLPNGEQDFALPPNLYVLGTMNTADKSIALVDIALRRRFEFRGFYPTKSVINDLAAEGKMHDDVPDLLAALNKKIFEKKGADFLVGHAYFINKITDQDLYTTLKRKVIPLLMEYFSGKVDLVRDLFSNSGYEVKYDTDNYDWAIAKARHAV